MSKKKDPTHEGKVNFSFILFKIVNNPFCVLLTILLKDLLFKLREINDTKPLVIKLFFTLRRKKNSMNISSYITSQILIVKLFTCPFGHLSLISKVTYNTKLHFYILFHKHRDLMLDIFLQVNNYLNSLKLTSCQKYFLQTIICLTQGRLSHVSDKDLIANTKLNEREIYKKLEYLKLHQYIIIKIINKKRHIKVNLPQNLKNFFYEQERFLTFYGKPVEEIITNYNGKSIREIKLLDVYSVDGHIHFKEYWILKEAIIESESESESESGVVRFKALSYITKSAHFLIRPFKDQIQPLGVHA